MSELLNTCIHNCTYSAVHNIYFSLGMTGYMGDGLMYCIMPSVKCQS